MAEKLFAQPARVRPVMERPPGALFSFGGFMGQRIEA